MAPPGLPILRMNPINPEFSVQEILIRAAAEDSVDFRRDCDYPRCNIKLPAARVAQSLRFKQTFFTSAQLLVGLHECGGSLPYPRHQKANE